MRFDPVPHWAQLPDEISFRGQATSVAVDSSDRVYVFNRGTHPLIILDRNGKVLDAWDNEGRFDRPHSIRIDKDDFIWLVDDQSHTVQKRTLSGELVLQLGERGKPAPWLSGRPFNRPTDATVHHRSGDIFVSDGYGNARVHRFKASGELLLSWGRPGTEPGEFSLPHNLIVTDDDRVLVCDRESFQIQVFSVEGQHIDRWHLHRPFCIAQGKAPDELLYVGEMRSAIANRKGIPRLGSCVKVLTLEGEQVARFGGDLPGQGPDQFMSLHGIATDSRGDVYVAEVSNSWIRDFGEFDGEEMTSLRKWRRVPSRTERDSLSSQTPSSRVPRDGI